MRQYVVANVGMFGAKGRLQGVLAFLGPHGYELVTVYDKASNWFGGMEKGFMLFKREVPPGQEPDGPWCGVVDDAWACDPHPRATPSRHPHNGHTPTRARRSPGDARIGLRVTGSRGDVTAARTVKR